MIYLCKLYTFVVTLYHPNDLFANTIFRCHYHWHFVSPFLYNRPPINRLSLRGKLISQSVINSAIAIDLADFSRFRKHADHLLALTALSMMWDLPLGMDRDRVRFLNRVPMREAKRSQLRESSLRFRDRSRDPGKRNLPFSGKGRGGRGWTWTHPRERFLLSQSKS